MPRTRRSPGTQTVLDVLRSGFRRPDPDAVTKLIDEMDAGRLATQPVAVSCYLRGTASALPRRWQYGVLILDGHSLTWRRYITGQRAPRRVPSHLDVEQVRDVSGVEGLHLKAELFQIIVGSRPPYLVTVLPTSAGGDARPSVPAGLAVSADRPGASQKLGLARGM
ncbi:MULTISPECIES: hypothetical protein [unclassified Pseudofrankia]|uniref:hypothetical protein n=1 Tax=unclassified Pseudofrankia TaxID=2994372 RepID=UPI00104221B6|nr:MULTISPECIES: hypothetical protein [unclassified Pseudofrankia]MDT3440644.1 hypothetical protein [Pseudofrankia sp. BMG5.37]